MSRRAIILAGGKGTRLRPYTVVLPKPLMPIGDYSILEVIIRQLVFYKFTQITLAVNFHADIFKAFFGNGAKWGTKIDYSLETVPLGTMGPLGIMKNLPENFLVMNGDVLTDINFQNIFKRHVKNRNIFTIPTHIRTQKVDYGVLELSKTGKLTGFKEKPELKYNVSMGVYIANKSILKYITRGKPYGFDDLVLALIKAKKYPAVIPYHGNWLDIGRPDDYMLAIDTLEKHRGRYIK